MDKRTEPAYWKKRIEDDGIDVIEGILSVDRSLPGADIIRARNDAISSYRWSERKNKFMIPKYIIGVLIIVSLVLVAAIL